MNPLLIVAIIVVALIVLSCGGCLAVFALAPDPGPPTDFPRRPAPSLGVPS
jgi:hypothetical protein